MASKRSPPIHKNLHCQVSSPEFGATRYEHTSEDVLLPLKSYKYSSVDNSLLTHYLLRHYWNACAEYLPLWLAPNMVTLIGFSFIIANVALLVMYIPDFIGPGPSWVYYSFAFGLWMYQTMDNIDGKQARRTGQSSPLGELFDHGIDSLNCTLASLLETAALGMGTTRRESAFTALIPCLPMFFSTWETYHTHTLYLGYFNGPTEGLLIACMVMLLSGYFGPSIWHVPILHYLPSSMGTILPFSLLTPSTTIIDIWIPFIMATFLVAHLPACLYNVVGARRAQKLPISPIFIEWTPIVVYTLSIGLWLYSPYSIVMRDNHLVVFCITMSFVFGRMTTKIILAHLTRQPFPKWTMMLVPLVGGAILVHLPTIGWALGRDWPPLDPRQELTYLYVFCGLAFGLYMQWAFVVIGSICRYLDINCLTITPRLLPGSSAAGKTTSGGVVANGKVKAHDRGAEEDGHVVAGKNLRSRKVSAARK